MQTDLARKQSILGPPLHFSPVAFVVPSSTATAPCVLVQLRPSEHLRYRAGHRSPRQGKEDDDKVNAG